MRIFLTGASGLLGRGVARACEGDEVTAPSHRSLDLVDADAVAAAIMAAAPHAVVHCAAMSDVDACERDPARAALVNELATANVARASAAAGARLVAVSTDYVFGVSRGRALDETDVPDPLNAYGRTKRAGELAALTLSANTVVARVSWLYDGSCHGFTGLVRRWAERGRAIRAPEDQLSVPTSVRAAARGLRQLAAMDIAAIPGRVVHVVCGGGATRLSWARAIVHALAVPVQVSPARLADFGGAPRPLDTRLDNGLAVSLGLSLPPWRDEVVDVVRGALGG